MREKGGKRMEKGKFWGVSTFSNGITFPGFARPGVGARGFSQTPQGWRDPQIQGFAGLVGFLSSGIVGFPRPRDCGILRSRDGQGLRDSSDPRKILTFLGKSWPSLGNPGFPWKILAFLGKSWLSLEDYGLEICALPGKAPSCGQGRGPGSAGIQSLISLTPGELSGSAALFPSRLPALPFITGSRRGNGRARGRGGRRKRTPQKPPAGLRSAR